MTDGVPERDQAFPEECVTTYRGMALGEESDTDKSESEAHSSDDAFSDGEEEKKKDTKDKKNKNNDKNVKKDKSSEKDNSSSKKKRKVGFEEDDKKTLAALRDERDNAPMGSVDREELEHDLKNKLKRKTDKEFTQVADMP